MRWRRRRPRPELIQRCGVLRCCERPGVCSRRAQWMPADGIRRRRLEEEDVCESTSSRDRALIQQRTTQRSVSGEWARVTVVAMEAPITAPQFVCDSSVLSLALVVAARMRRGAFESRCAGDPRLPRVRLHEQLSASIHHPLALSLSRHRCVPEPWTQLDLHLPPPPPPRPLLLEPLLPPHLPLPQLDPLLPSSAAINLPHSASLVSPLPNAPLPCSDTDSTPRTTAAAEACCTSIWHSRRSTAPRPPLPHRRASRPQLPLHRPLPLRCSPCQKRR